MDRLHKKSSSLNNCTPLICEAAPCLACSTRGMSDSPPRGPAHPRPRHSSSAPRCFRRIVGLAGERERPLLASSASQTEAARSPAPLRAAEPRVTAQWRPPGFGARLGGLRALRAEKHEIRHTRNQAGPRWRLRCSERLWAGKELAGHLFPHVLAEDTRVTMIAVAVDRKRRVLRRKAIANGKKVCARRSPRPNPCCAVPTIRPPRILIAVMSKPRRHRLVQTSRHRPWPHRNPTRGRCLLAECGRLRD